MTTPQMSEFKHGECTWCGDKGEVYRDNGRCEQCDSDVFRCTICKDDVHCDDLCRHVFRDNDLEWSGSGAYAPSATVKFAFLELLTLMPDGFAADLRTAIRSGRFYTWLCAPLIGSGGTLALNGMPKRNERWMCNAWGRDLIDIGDGPHAEETADGYHWLASLYERKTLKANKLTIAWIDEWQRDRVPPAGVWFWHSPVRSAHAETGG